MGEDQIKRVPKDCASSEAGFSLGVSKDAGPFKIESKVIDCS